MDPGKQCVGKLAFLIAHAVESSGANADRNLVDAFKYSLRGIGEDHAFGPAVAGIGPPLHIAGGLQPIQNTAQRHRLDTQTLRKRALAEVRIMLDEGKRPRLRCRQAGVGLGEGPFDFGTEGLIRKVSS